MAYLDNAGVTTLVKTIASKTKTLVATKADKSLLGAKNGIATLDANGLVPSAQLPSYVDDVLEFDKKANFPATGEAGKIYVALDSNLTYRWSGTAYVEISKSLGVGITAGTAFDGKRGADLESKVNTMNTTLNSVKSKADTNATNIGKLPMTALQTINEHEGFFYASLDESSSLICAVNQSGQLDISIPIVNFDGSVDTDTVSIPTATTSSPGIMSKDDKSALESLKTFKGTAGSTYLTKTDAANTYLTKTAAASTYQTKMSAIDNTSLTKLINDAWTAA